MMSPRIVSSVTETSAKTTVFPTARHQSGSPASAVKFASPTASCAPMFERFAFVNAK
jgi:hypothetical protein